MEVSTEWLGTFYEVAAYISSATRTEQWPAILKQKYENHGKAGIYALAMKWTNEFERKYKGRKWNGDWNETMWEFMNERLI